MPESIEVILAESSRAIRSENIAIYGSKAQESFSPRDFYMQRGTGYSSAMIWEVRFMTVVKSDAMLQHEKTIAEVVAHRPKRSNDEVMHIEWRNILVVAAAVVAVVIAISSM